MNITANNHFVPRVYLRNFSSDGKQIWSYKILVPDSRIPPWNLISISKKAAVQKNLYTSMIGGKESDELENFLAQEVEAPAGAVILKIINNSPILKSDWEILIKFFALQYVRTPAYYAKIKSKLEENILNLNKKGFRESLQTIETREAHSPEDYKIKNDILSRPINLTFKVKEDIDKNQDLSKLQSKILLCREGWIFYMNRVLILAEILKQHRWTILCPPENRSWITSDNPVIQLNCKDYDDYNLDGAWGTKNTDLMLPLSPKHLLYTQVGNKVPQKGTKLPLHQFEFVQKIIAENAHRTIFADQEYVEINKLRKREVNVEKYQHEQQEWREWHEVQTIPELDFA